MVTQSKLTTQAMHHEHNNVIPTILTEFIMLNVHRFYTYAQTI